MLLGVDRFSDTAVTLAGLRKIVLAILIVGMAGAAAELVLLEHDEDATQLIPLVLIGLGFVVLAWHARRHTRSTILAIQIVMILFVAAGALGIFFHYQANVEFQREMEPAIGGSTLLWAVLRAKTPPALAPGMMVQLGLLGLAYAYRHPAVSLGDSLEENRDDA
jgi:hypothetical protein